MFSTLTLEAVVQVLYLAMDVLALFIVKQMMVQVSLLTSMPSDKFALSAAYFATGRNTAANPAPGRGLFDGSNTIFGQLAFKPN